MNKNKTLIALAVFAVSILFSNVYTAYAQIFNVVSGMQERVRAISYQANTDSFWILSEGNGFTWLHQIDRSTRSLIFSYNHTDTFDDLSAGSTQDIWCGQTSCYITTTLGLVVGITTVDISPNIFKGINVTGSYNHVNTLGHITGRDQVSGGFGSVTLWIDTFTGTNRNVIIVDGISFTLTGTLPAYGTIGVNERVHDIRWSEVAGITDNDLITTTGFTTDTAGQNSIVVYNLATLAIKCNVATPSTNNPLPVAPNYIGAGDSNNKFYVGSIDGLVYVYNENTCGVVQTFSTGLTGDIRFLDYDSGRLFVQENGANAFIKQFLTNSTGHILSTNVTYAPLPSVAQDTFDSVDTTLTNARGWLLAGNGQFWFPYTGTMERIGILIYDEESSSPPAGGGNSVNGRCGVGTVLDCIGDRSVGLAVTGGSDITTVSESLFCGIGFNTTCSGDPKENGTGLLLMLITGVFFTGIVFITIASANTRFGAGIAYTEIPKELWLFLVVGVVALAFYFEWIPDIVFYGMITGLAGLFAFGLYKHIRGG